VAVVEARRVGRQATGQSTAKVTSQHGLVYQRLERSLGEERARLYAEAQEGGLRTIREFVSRYGIDCDLERKSAITYACDETTVEQIEREAELARSFGIDAALVRETELPFDVRAAVRFDGQAQFDPTRYVAGLAQSIPGEGCHVFENSRAIDWEPTAV